MPIQYTTPSWLRGADPLEAAIHGSSLGQRIAESNQRAAAEYMALQQRQQQFQQTMEMHQQQLEQAQAEQQQNFQARQEIEHQNQIQKQQQLAVDNAYKQSQLGLAKQKLELTTQAAAKKFQTQQLLQSEINNDANSLMAEEGMDPDEARQKATIRAYMRHATDLGLNPQGLAALAKSAGGEDKAYSVETVHTDRGDYKVIRNPSGAAQILERPEKDLKVPAPRFTVNPADPLDPTSQPTLGKITGIQADQLGQFGITNKYNFNKPAPVAAPTGAPAVAPAASPQAAAAMPQPIPLTGLKKEDLQDGVPYITAKGTAVWDKKKEKFNPMAAAPESAPVDNSSDEE